LSDGNLPQPGFCGAQIDRADAIRSNPERLAELQASLGARLLQLKGLDPVPGDEPGTLAWTSLLAAPEGAEIVFLGLLDGTPRFAAVPASAAVGSSRPLPPWRILALIDDASAALYAGARSLVDWHMRHRFCAACGAATTLTKGGWQRDCTGCGASHFPRTDPVVIMLAEHEDAVLVGRQAAWPEGRFSALAGFVEPGESLEDAVRRELFEEAGLHCGDVRYVASQPWPFPSSLMIGCIAAAPGRDVVLDTTELCDSLWVTRAQVRAALSEAPDAPFAAPPPYAIAHTLLARWAMGSI
jgi:NAD+ diphosphatase